MNEQRVLMNLRCPAGVEVIDDMLEGHQRYQVLLSSLDLGLYDFLAARGASPRDEIADALGINGLFIRDFLGVLVEAGFLCLEDDRYRNSHLATAFLVFDSPFYQGDVIRNVTRNSFWNDLTAVLSGNETKRGPGGPSPGFIAALGQKALRGDLQFLVQTVAGGKDFGKAQRILDVGGGHGLHTIALCQVNPQLQGVVLDQAGVVETTRRYIAAYGLEDRVTAVVGDIQDDSIGSGYDIVLISHLLYKFRKNLGQIFDTVRASLVPGGLFVSNHWFCAPGCISDGRSVQSLAKTLQSLRHPLCREEEFDALFEAKGFDVIATVLAPATHGSTRLQLAQKRAAEPSP